MCARANLLVVAVSLSQVPAQVGCVRTSASERPSAASKCINTVPMHAKRVEDEGLRELGGLAIEGCGTGAESGVSEATHAHARALGACALVALAI